MSEFHIFNECKREGWFGELILRCGGPFNVNII